MNITNEMDITTDLQYKKNDLYDYRPFGQENIPVPDSALDVQVGGGHYEKLKIQLLEFIHANNIPFIEGSCIQYLCRHKDEGGVKDLEKVIHCCKLLIELEYERK